MCANWAFAGTCWLWRREWVGQGIVAGGGVLGVGWGHVGGGGVGGRWAESLVSRSMHHHKKDHPQETHSGGFRVPTPFPPSPPLLPSSSSLLFFISSHFSSSSSFICLLLRLLSLSLSPPILHPPVAAWQLGEFLCFRWRVLVLLAVMEPGHSLLCAVCLNWGHGLG